MAGYALFVFAMNAGVHPIAAIPLAGIAAALFAVPTAFIVFRLRGAYFAIGTWVVAEVYMLSFAQVSALGGGSGMSLPAAVVKGIATGRMWRESAIYWTGLAIAVGAIALGLPAAPLAPRPRADGDSGFGGGIRRPRRR